MLHKWMKMYRRMERNVSEPDSGKNRFADRMKAKFPFRRNSFSDAPQNKEENAAAGEYAGGTGASVCGKAFIGR